MNVVLISSLVHPNLNAGVKLSACLVPSVNTTQLKAGLEPTQAHIQHNYLDNLLQIRMWRRKEQGKGRAAEVYLSTMFEAVYYKTKDPHFWKKKWHSFFSLGLFT